MEPPPPASNVAPVTPDTARLCPVCDAPLIEEKCKVVCRSSRCTYRLVYNCSEF
jgi:hypothetical protein